LGRIGTKNIEALLRASFLPSLSQGGLMLTLRRLLSIIAVFVFVLVLISSSLFVQQPVTATTNNPQMVKDINQTILSSNPRQFTTIDGITFFIISDEYGLEP
jgi:hypothetical protein